MSRWSGPIGDFLSLVITTEFLSGLAIGLVAALLGWLFARRRPSGKPGGAGLAAVSAGAWLVANGKAPSVMVAVLILLAVLGGSGYLERSPLRRAGAGGFAALALVLGIGGGPLFRLALFAVVSAVVFAVSAAEKSLERGVPTAVLFSAAALALVIGIPEIDRALVLAGSLVPFMLLRTHGRRLGRAGAAAYPALFAWVAFADGVTASGGVVGVLGSLGVLGLGYLAPRIVGPISTKWLIAGQFAWALFASRVAGLRRGFLAAVAILSLGTLVVWGLSRLWRPEVEVATFGGESGHK